MGTQQQQEIDRPVSYGWGGKNPDNNDNESSWWFYTRNVLYLLLMLLLTAHFTISVFALVSDGMVQYTPHLPPGWYEAIANSSDASIASADLATFVGNMRPLLPNGVNTSDTKMAGCAKIGFFETTRCERKSEHKRPLADWDTGEGCGSYLSFVVTVTSFHMIAMVIVLVPSIGSVRVMAFINEGISPKNRVEGLLVVVGWCAAVLVCNWLAVVFAAALCTSPLCRGSGAKPLSETGTCEPLWGTEALWSQAYMSTSATVMFAILLFKDLCVVWANEDAEKTRLAEEEEAAAWKKKEKEESKEKEKEEKKKHKDRSRDEDEEVQPEQEAPQGGEHPNAEERTTVIEMRPLREYLNEHLKEHSSASGNLQPAEAPGFVAPPPGAIEEGADGDDPPVSPTKRDETAEEKRERKKRKKEKKEKREKKQAEKLAASDMKEDV